MLRACAGPGRHGPGLPGAGERGGLDEDVGEGGVEAGAVGMGLKERLAGAEYLELGKVRGCATRLPMWRNRREDLIRGN
jgi:hypothetical protein